MKLQHAAVPLFIVAIASSGAYLTATHHDINGSLQATEDHHDDHVEHHEHHNGVTPQAMPNAAHDHAAIDDMSVRALATFGHATIHPNSFGAAPDWHPDWELRWIAFDADDEHVVFLYHATYVHDPAVRLTWMEDGSHQWQRAR